MSKLTDMTRIYAREYRRLPYGREIEGTAELLLQLAEKLAEYENLEEQGKLLKLPCTVGDKIYTVYSDKKGSFTEELEVLEISTHRVWTDSSYFDYDDFGKTVFFTREEAETALKELVSDNA